MTENESAREIAIETVRGSATGIATETIFLAGKARGCLGDTESVPWVERGTKTAHEKENEKGNGRDTEITEIDTANLVSLSLIYT